MNRRPIWICALVMMCIARVDPAASQTTDQSAVSAALDRLGISIPSTISGAVTVKEPLEELGREPCDQKAIEQLASALQYFGRRREAANAYLGFSDSCGHHTPSLRAAINILMTLSDYDGAAAAATDLIGLEPFNDNGYYLRALAKDRQGLFKPAIDDYATAIELFGNKSQISSVAYLAMARDYEKLGQFCNAVTPIETWVALNPARNDTSQTRAIIAGYTAKGNCPPAPGGVEVFKAVRQSNNIIKLPVSINGVAGTFMLDTGATFVTLSNGFAQKAKAQVDPDSKLRIHTANGIIDAKQGRAASVQLRSLQAKDVAIAVEADEKATFGSGVDGLLGMSFLSHFKISIDTQAVRIAGRTAK